MATQITQAEWYEKLKSWVPAWFLREERIAKAYFMALAKVASEIQGVVDQHVADTFILQSHKGVLDTHGAERDVERLPNEIDLPYSIRVQSLLNQSNPTDLLNFITKILVTGRARISEDFDAVLFLDREYFCNRGALLLEDATWLNVFSVIVDKQQHAPYSFTDREFFISRTDFIGSDVSSDFVFDLITKIVDDNKALGTLYRIIELLE